MQQDIIDRIAEEKNMNPALVRRIVASQFMFMIDAMKERKSFRLAYIGTIEFNQQRFDKIQEIVKNKEC